VADRHQTVRPLAIDSTAMSAAKSSARTSLPLNPRALRSFSSSVIASLAVAGRRTPGIAPTAGTGSANQTALPRIPVPDNRDLVR
jgi:hypothetical protein